MISTFCRDDSHSIAGVHHFGEGRFDGSGCGRHVTLSQLQQRQLGLSRLSELSRALEISLGPLKISA